ncbi:cohesin domain-containing protein [Geomesophilobacter sediminis]|uniref:Cohesin domain-containing protein n=1 Tax=Geomesophilobacter sediminis TaxID=2798584 RepID=A0A8J7JLM9_9BACT|nr:cohesin domain-containing protein [Geomesophilobacter sediminis]MBJ6725075.1 hypothetical protein [Geomesophilobacter sediminis]
MHIRQLFSGFPLWAALLLASGPAFATPAVRLTFVGNNTFVLSGANFERVGRVELSFAYDTALLTNPRATPKATFPGASLTQGDDAGGNVGLTVVSDQPMTGSGPLGTIAFDAAGDSSGAITALNGKVFSANGERLPVFFSVTNPTPQLDPNDPDDEPMIRERERKGETARGGGVSYVPPEAAAAPQGSGPDGASAATETAAAGGASLDPAPSPGQAAARDGGQPGDGHPVSVLERLHRFAGERTVQSLIALFQPESSARFTQNPAVAIADGSTPVRVTVTGVSPGLAPRFTFNSARYRSHRKLADDAWLVEAVPDKGALRAEITVFEGERQRQVPLVAAPAVRVDLITPGKVTEADFELFLSERGTAEHPAHDLNGDGRRDYLDDYIFTANYLAQRAAGTGTVDPGKEAAISSPEDGTGKALAGGSR